MNRRQKAAHAGRRVADETTNIALRQVGDAEAPAIVESFQIETSHARISVCQTADQGLPVVFLHGNSSSKEIFQRQFCSSFGGTYRCIGLDLPGHGASADAHDPRETYSISGYADAIAEVFEALDLEQAVVVGWSLGGHIALEMVASFPGIVGALLVGAPPIRVGFRGILQGFRFHPLAPLLAARSLSEEQIDELARAIVGPAHGPSVENAVRRTDGQARELMFRSMLYGNQVDQRDLVETSKTPIAIVAGADDPFVDTRYLQKLAYANLWNGRCHLIPDAGHAPFINADQIFNSLLSRFAADMNRRARALRAAPQLVYSG